MKLQISIICTLCILLLTSCIFFQKTPEEISHVIRVEGQENKQKEVPKNTRQIDTLLAKGNTQNALKLARDEYKKLPTNPYVQVNYAQALLFHGNQTYSQQENALKAIDILHPLASTGATSYDPFVWTMLGYSYEILEDYDNAIICYDSALLIHENDPVILAYKGQSLRLKGEKIKSEEAIEQAYGLDSENPFIAAKVGHIYFARGENEKAKKVYEFIIEKSDNLRLVSEAYYTLGNFAFSNKDYKNSRIMFEKSIETDESYDASYIGLARLLFIQQMDAFREQGEAPSQETANKPFELLSTALKINTKNTLAYYIFAQMYFSLGQYDLAQEHLVLANKVLGDDLTLSQEQRTNMQRDISILSNKVFERKSGNGE